MFYEDIRFVYIFWDVAPPTQLQCKVKVYRDPLFKICAIYCGPCYWMVREYIIYRLFLRGLVPFPLRLRSSLKTSCELPLPLENRCLYIRYIYIYIIWYKDILFLSLSIVLRFPFKRPESDSTLSPPPGREVESTSTAGGGAGNRQKKIVGQGRCLICGGPLKFLLIFTKNHGLWGASVLFSCDFVWQKVFFWTRMFSRGSNLWWINETSPYLFRGCWPWRRDGNSLPQWTRPTLYKWELLKLFIILFVFCFELPISKLLDKWHPYISLWATIALACHGCLRWGSHGHSVCVHRCSVYAYADRYIACIDSAYMQIYTHHHVYIYTYLYVQILSKEV